MYVSARLQGLDARHRFYLEDVDHAIARVRDEVAGGIHATMLSITSVALVAILLVCRAFSYQRNLQDLSYGKDGYFFGYDSQSVRVFWADKNVKIGESFRDFVDANGLYVINKLVRVAKDKTHYLNYSFPVPGRDESVPKIGYAIYLDKWDLMYGTAVNLDDIEAQVAKVAAELDERIDTQASRTQQSTLESKA